MQYLVLKFITNHSPYSIGEVAGFPEKRAERLIELGVAVLHDPKNTAEADGLRALRGAPKTRHIPGPDKTKKTDGPKCGLCRKPGHTRANCPEKK